MEQDSPFPIFVQSEKYSMKNKLMDILSVTIMCLAFVLVIKVLALVKEGLMSENAKVLIELVKSLPMTRS